MWDRHDLGGVRTVAPTASAYLTSERLALQEQARAFAMDEVLPVADELELFLVEKDRGGFPTGVSGTAIDKIGYFGLTTWQLDIERLRLPAGALHETGLAEGVRPADRRSAGDPSPAG